MVYNNDTLLAEAIKGDETSLNRLIENNTGLVKSVAGRFFNRGYDREEILQLGMIGLFKAIRNFDFSYGVKFSTYAVPLISGEIKRFLRDNGFIKVSRQTKELASLILEKSLEYEKQTGLSPTVSELSRIIGHSPEDIIFAMNSTESVSSLDSMINDDENSARILKIQDDNAAFEEQTVNRITLTEILHTLNPRERQVITLRYFSNMTQKQVSEKIGVSQVQVSRIEKKVLDKIRQLV